jgi:hypothetical protein
VGVSEAPSTRHGDVLLTVWIVVGATMFFVLLLSDTVPLPHWALAIVGAGSAGYGEAVSRRLRPHLRFTETAVGVVVAFLLLPHVTRFGSGALFDTHAIVTIAVGAPLGLGAAWHVRHAKLGAGGYPEIAAGIFVIAAAVALGVMLLVATEPSGRIERQLEIMFLMTSIAAGLTLGALAPGARPGHLIVGGLCVFLAPRVLQLGFIHELPLYDVLRWTGALGVGGTLGCLVGKWLRVRAAARSAAAMTNLPVARVHDGDAGEPQDPR